MKVLESKVAKKFVPFHVLKIGDYFKYKNCYCLKIGVYNYIYPDMVCGWDPFTMEDTATEVEYLPADVIVYEGADLVLEAGDVFTVEDDNVYKSCIKLINDLYYDCNDLCLRELDKNKEYKKTKIDDICISGIDKIVSFKDIEVNKGFIAATRVCIKIRLNTAIALNNGGKVDLWEDYDPFATVRQCNIEFVKHEEV